MADNIVGEWDSAQDEERVLPLISVGREEQANRELLRFAVNQGGIPLIFLTHDERKAFESGSLNKVLRKYLVHQSNDNFVVLVAASRDFVAQPKEGSRILGLLLLGPFFSLRDPLFADLSPWTLEEYQGLRDDRRALMRATLNEKVAAKSWWSAHFEPRALDVPTYAFRVQMILLFPPPLDEKRVVLEPEALSQKKNGQLFNDTIFLGIASLLDIEVYNKRATRPFKAVYGPSASGPPIQQEQFDLLFYGGAPSLVSKTFAQSPPTFLQDQFIPLVPSRDPSTLDLGSVESDAVGAAVELGESGGGGKVESDAVGAAVELGESGGGGKVESDVPERRSSWEKVVVVARSNPTGAAVESRKWWWWQGRRSDAVGAAVELGESGGGGKVESDAVGAAVELAQISSIDRRIWTEDDVRISMINAFGTVDEPRQVRSVSVDTPIAGAVTFKNSGDMGRYNLKLITGFLMANLVQTRKFVAYVAGVNNEAPIDVEDPCSLTSYKAQNEIIGLSTLYADTQSDVYTGRLTTEVKHLLENVDKNSFYVESDMFQINEILKTNPFTSNYLLCARNNFKKWNRKRQIKRKGSTQTGKYLKS
ncbi:hypothetical protein CYMTET_51675 [Cymbomonas tetramitiformis]|uniref:Uncharacterized protein n=1 Tax=Cymbomonas tetramitiformis TaxID=36881 RepID=A0AAE0ERK1_9CHLO|nr:hypothetical protein CYMTET_51675 [Cymbomonas tetramitiformis]